MTGETAKGRTNYHTRSPVGDVSYVSARAAVLRGQNVGYPWRVWGRRQERWMGRKEEWTSIGETHDPERI
jgi:hypothetical protein